MKQTLKLSLKDIKRLKKCNSIGSETGLDNVPFLSQWVVDWCTAGRMNPGIHPDDLRVHPEVLSLMEYQGLEAPETVCALNDTSNGVCFWAIRLGGRKYSDAI